MSDTFSPPQLPVEQQKFGPDRNDPLAPLIATLPHEIARHRVLTSAEAAAFCGLSEDWWGRMHRAGNAPRPIRLSGRRLGWRIGELIDWLDQRARES